jgi:HSP20 family protein
MAGAASTFGAVGARQSGHRRKPRKDHAMTTSLLNFPDGLFAEFERARRDMDAMLGFTGATRGIRAVSDGGYPAINVGQTPQSVDVFVFAPGIDPAQVDITLDRGVLSIAGERQLDLPSDESKGIVYGQERLSGRFRRAVSLPDDIDPNKVSASYSDGVLRINVARREAVQPKRIAIA